MEPKGSLPCSQKFTNGFCPEPALYILIFKFLYDMERQKIVDWMTASIPWI
jgi:hypothetical protein